RPPGARAVPRAGASRASAGRGAPPTMAWPEARDRPRARSARAAASDRAADSRRQVQRGNHLLDEPPRRLAGVEVEGLPVGGGFERDALAVEEVGPGEVAGAGAEALGEDGGRGVEPDEVRSEEQTSEIQSREKI